MPEPERKSSQLATAIEGPPSTWLATWALGLISVFNSVVPGVIHDFSSKSDASHRRNTVRTASIMAESEVADV